jgi:hypothetical protein
MKKVKNVSQGNKPPIFAESAYRCLFLRLKNTYHPDINFIDVNPI